MLQASAASASAIPTSAGRCCVKIIQSQNGSGSAASQ